MKNKDLAKILLRNPDAVVAIHDLHLRVVRLALPKTFKAGGEKVTVLEIDQSEQRYGTQLYQFDLEQKKLQLVAVLEPTFKTSGVSPNVSEGLVSVRVKGAKSAEVWALNEKVITLTPRDALQLIEKHPQARGRSRSQDRCKIGDTVLCSHDVRAIVRCLKEVIVK